MPSPRREAIFPASRGYVPGLLRPSTVTIRAMTRAVFLASAMLGLLATSNAQQPDYDVLVTNGRVLDGSGNPWFTADIATSGDRIVAVGRLDGAKALRVIDAAGLVVAPGFIDVHSHAAEGLGGALHTAVPLLAQGITTVFINPDGVGPTDLIAQRSALEARGVGVNVAQFVPHGSVRQAVLGMADRAPTSAELASMTALTRTGMEAGGVGLSSGLYYAPGSYATTDEVIALAKVAAELGGVYSSHIRDEADYSVGVVAAVQEVIRVAEEAHLPRRRLAHEGARARAVGPVDGVDHTNRAGPCTRRAGLRGSVSGRGERHRVVGGAGAAVGAGRRARGLRQAPRWRRARAIKTAIADNLARRGGPGALVISGYAPDRSLEGSRWRPSPPTGARRPRTWWCRYSRRATAAWCRSTCPSATSPSSCGSPGR